MDIHSLVSTLETVLHEYSGMGFFVDLLLKSLFVLVLIVGMNLFTGRLAASARHLIWCVGILCLLVLPLFIGFLPKIHVPISTPETVVIENTVTRGIVTLADNHSLTLEAGWNAFLSVYFTLLGMQLLYIFLGLCKVISLSRSANPVTNPAIVQELDNLVLDEGITVPVRLKQSSEIFSPISWGLFAPEIIVPAHAENWCAAKTRNVLIHELSHIQRLDWLTSLLTRITRALYWYNPLIWYAARKLDEETEQACDDAVILNGRCHNEYASNLLEIASYGRLTGLGNAVVQAIAGSFLGSRVFSILDTSRKRQNTEVVWVVRGLLVGCVVIAILASLRFVPLVNVTSIDPHASTAFSVIFIPKSEASAYGDYVENLFEFEQQDQHEPEVKADRDASGDLDASEAGGVMASSDGGQSGNAGNPEEAPSVLEEFISATGIREGESSFRQYVNDYTSDVIRNVQSGIDITCLTESMLTEEDRAREEARLVAIRTSKPEYPRSARRRGLEGYSIVEYAIDSNGEVHNAVIVDSSPGSVFNRSSLRAIQSYRFEPPTLNGEVVSLEGRQTKFVYQLKPG